MGVSHGCVSWVCLMGLSHGSGICLICVIQSGGGYKAGVKAKRVDRWPEGSILVLRRGRGVVVVAGVREETTISSTRGDYNIFNTLPHDTSFSVLQCVGVSVCLSMWVYTHNTNLLS